MDFVLFLSLIVGLIDGDGTIRQAKSRGKLINTCCVRIKMHRSWLEFLTMCCRRLCCISDLTLPKINKQGYAQWEFCNRRAMCALASTVNENHLPAMISKWDCVMRVYKGGTLCQL
jgi:hypothetical protein